MDGYTGSYEYARLNDLWYDLSTNSVVDRTLGNKLIAERKRVGNQKARLLGTHTRQIRSFEMNMNGVSRKPKSSSQNANIVDRWTSDTMVVIPESMDAKGSLLNALEQARIPFYNWEEFGGLAVVLSRNHRQEAIQALNSEGMKVAFQSREVVEQERRNSQVSTFEYQISRKGQDRYFQFVEDGVMISLLFDGHGTDTVIDYISSHRTDFLELGIEPFPETNAEVFERVNKVFNDFENNMRTKIKDLYSGSTLVTAVHKISTRKAFFAHIGDSRAVWFIDKKVSGTKDHKPSDDSEKSRILSLGGKVTQARRDVPRVNDNLATSRSFGDETLKTRGNTEADRQKDLVSVIPSVYGPFTFPAGSFYGMGSDGVFDVLSNEEVATMMSGQARSDNIAKRIVDTAVSKGSLDDITFGCVYVQ